ncbi:IS66 family transposase [Streptomyces griseorubiginosus]|uniref:IS66 family transposase n=1 Tax=Streptomyces griseorubiginosus TaxID=67304 RepID=UPI0036E6C400
MSESELPSYAKLASLVGELRAELSAARVEIAELRAENAELRRQLGMNSKNSSKPPSSDGFVKPKSLRKPSGRGPGKPTGGPGGTLPQVENPDRTLVHVPLACTGCASELADAEVVSVERRQVFNLPEIRPRVTEHHVEHRRCACGTTTAATAPDGVSAPTQYGPGVRALAVYLINRQHLPYARCAELLADCLGLQVATASLLTWNEQAAMAVAAHTETVRAQLTGCEVVGFDETGTRVAGRTCWVHTACTRSLTLYSVHAKRGVDAFTAMGVLPHFTGIAVHDGWKPYKTYTGAAHALCNAHHLRELASVVENAGPGAPQEWASQLAELLVEIWDTIKGARAEHAWADGFGLDELERYAARYDTLIATGRQLHPPRAPGTRTKRSKTANLLDRLDTERDQVLRFAFDWRVPFDNNRSEQAIRMVKVQQKISNGWRTIQGAERFLAMRGYLSTAAKQGKNLLDVTRRLFDGRGAWIPTPT